jgi:hypothetical protein
MRMSVAVRALGAVLLLGAAVLARNEARRARTEATAWQQLVTLQMEQASTTAPTASWLTSLIGAATNERRRLATVDYWQGRYSNLVQRDSAADPHLSCSWRPTPRTPHRHDRPVGPKRRGVSIRSCRRTRVVLKPHHVMPTRRATSIPRARVRDQIRVMKTTPGERPAGRLRRRRRVTCWPDRMDSPVARRASEARRFRSSSHANRASAGLGPGQARRARSREGLRRLGGSRAELGLRVAARRRPARWGIFGAPAYLWLLAVPAALLVLWTCSAVRGHRCTALRADRYRPCAAVEPPRRPAALAGCRPRMRG